MSAEPIPVSDGFRRMISWVAVGTVALYGVAAFTWVHARILLREIRYDQGKELMEQTRVTHRLGRKAQDNQLRGRWRFAR